MRILLVTPANLHQGRGNMITVARWRRGLEKAGCEVVLGEADADLEVLGKGVDLVHAHHAVRAGPAAAACARSYRVPLVVSLGGTDLYGEGGDPDPRGRAVLRAARRIVGPLARDAERLGDADLARRFRTVRRGVEPPGRQPPGTPTGALRMLCVGALRPVKGHLAAVRLVAALRERDLEATLTIIGPTADEDTLASLVAAGRDRPWLRLEEPRPHQEMAVAYAAADVLLNTSLVEGASNAILEAWAHGLRVLASDVPGNRDLLEPAPASCARLLGAAGEPCSGTVAWLRRGPGGSSVRSSAAAARAWVATAHDPADEIRELLAVYRGALTPE